MPNDVTLLLLAVLVPVAGSLGVPLAARVSPRAAARLSLGLAAATLAACAGLLPAVLAGRDAAFSVVLPLGFNVALRADALAVFTAVMSSLISTIIVLYSQDYIRPYRNPTEYYLMVVLFLGSMMGLVFSVNLILLYVFWELTAFSSWRLIGFFREDYHVARANKAFLVTGFGALAMLLGFVGLYVQTGSLDLDAVRAALHGVPISHAATALILLGILSKSATLPLHSWLPDAGVAPSPVTALLHAAVLVKIGVYVYARLFVVALPIDPFWQAAMLTIAAASALVSAGAALVDTDLKRIIAYSTVSQIAFIFLGLAAGSHLALTGALLYILMHGLAKAGLFLCAGIVEQGTHTKDVRKLGGLARTMPLTAAAFLLCAFSVMGVPPFGGFFSKYMVMAGAVQGGWGGIAAVFLLGAVLTILYLLRVFVRVFLGSPGEHSDAPERSPLMVACVVLLAVLSLAGGLLIRWPAQVADFTAGMMAGGPR